MINYIDKSIIKQYSQPHRKWHTMDHIYNNSSLEKLTQNINSIITIKKKYEKFNKKL